MILKLTYELDESKEIKSEEFLNMLDNTIPNFQERIDTALKKVKENYAASLAHMYPNLQVEKVLPNYLTELNFTLRVKGSFYVEIELPHNLKKATRLELESLDKPVRFKNIKNEINVKSVKEAINKYGKNCLVEVIK